jgi:hypothetical protein
LFKVIDAEAAIPYDLPEPDEGNVWVLERGSGMTAEVCVDFVTMGMVNATKMAFKAMARGPDTSRDTAAAEFAVQQEVRDVPARGPAVASMGG